MMLIAILLPGVSFLLRGDFIAAILATMIQCTIVGWLPVALWAAVALHHERNQLKVSPVE